MPTYIPTKHVFVNLGMYVIRDTFLFTPQIGTTLQVQTHQGMFLAAAG